MVIRLLGMALILDRDTWTVGMDRVISPAREAGFSPDGAYYCMMNNLRQHSMAVFDSSDPDPRRWKKIAFVEDPAWRESHADPFHLVFSVDGRKVYGTLLRPEPANSSLAVVDTRDWRIVKQIDDIGPDAQTSAVTYDGNDVLTVFSGFQRYL